MKKKSAFGDTHRDVPNHKGTSPKPGTTLIEVLITLALLSIFLTLTVHLYIQGYSSYFKGTKTAFMFRQSALLFDSLWRETSECTKIYTPEKEGRIDLLSSLGYKPIFGENAPFIFATNNPKVNVIGYSVEKSTSTLVRMLYDPSFDPEDPTTWDVTELHRSNIPIEDLSFNLLPLRTKDPRFKILKFSLTGLSQEKSFYFESHVTIQPGFQYQANGF